MKSSNTRFKKSIQFKTIVHGRKEIIKITNIGINTQKV